MDLVCCPYNDTLHFHCTAVLLDIFQTRFICISEGVERISMGQGIGFVRNTKLTGGLSNCFSYFIVFFCSVTQCSSDFILSFKYFF